MPATELQFAVVTVQDPALTVIDVQVYDGNLSDQAAIDAARQDLGKEDPNAGTYRYTVHRAYLFTITRS